MREIHIALNTDEVRFYRKYGQRQYKTITSASKRRLDNLIHPPELVSGIHVTYACKPYRVIFHYSDWWPYKINTYNVHLLVGE